MAPANELQAAFYQALIGSADVAALVGDRVFDRVPMDGDQAPFITLGDGGEVPDATDCVVTADHAVIVNVWSENQGGYREAKEIAFAVKKAVMLIADLPTHALIGISLQDTRYLRDPDGITSQAVLTFGAMVEEN